MDIFEKDFLHDQLVKSLSLYSDNSLSSMRMLAHMRIVQAPIIKRVFKKISKETTLTEKEIERYNDSSEFEERMFSFSIVNQCSIFDALITDIETILILLEQKRRLTSIKTSPEEIASLSPTEIIIKGARSKAKENAFEGIKKRLSLIYTNYKLKNRPEIKLFEDCENIFHERHSLVHAPFSFSDTQEKKEWDPFADNDSLLRQKEATLGEISYKLCKQVLDQKFGDADQPMLILLKQTFEDSKEIEDEIERLLGPDETSIRK